MVVLALLPRWSAASIAYMGALVAVRAHFTTRILFAQEAVATRWRGTAAACVEMGSSLGTAVSAYLSGYLIVAAGYRWMFLAAAGASMLAVGMLSVYLRRQVRRPAVALAGPPG
jgi:MFS family permease